MSLVNQVQVGGVVYTAEDVANLLSGRDSYKAETLRLKAQREERRRDYARTLAEVMKAASDLDIARCAELAAAKRDIERFEASVIAASGTTAELSLKLELATQNADQYKAHFDRMVIDRRRLIGILREKGFRIRRAHRALIEQNKAGGLVPSLLVIFNEMGGAEHDEIECACELTKSDAAGLAAELDAEQDRRDGEANDQIMNAWRVTRHLVYDIRTIHSELCHDLANPADAMPHHEMLKGIQFALGNSLRCAEKRLDSKQVPARCRPWDFDMLWRIPRTGGPCPECGDTTMARQHGNDAPNPSRYLTHADGKVCRLPEPGTVYTSRKGTWSWHPGEFDAERRASADRRLEAAAYAWHAMFGHRPTLDPYRAEEVELWDAIAGLESKSDAALVRDYDMNWTVPRHGGQCPGCGATTLVRDWGTYDPDGLRHLTHADQTVCAIPIAAGQILLSAEGVWRFVPAVRETEVPQ